MGVILLATRFPRPVGDVGNSATFPQGALHEVVAGADLARVVQGDPRDPALLSGFLAARDRLVARGAALVTTSCGLLAPHQAALQQGCPVPVVSSALLQVPGLLAQGARVGLMAMDSRTLGPALLAASGLPPDMPVIGLEGGAVLYPTLQRNRAEDRLDLAAATAEVVAAGRALLQANPDLTALVLECANLPPYRAALEQALGLPVHDLLTAIADRMAAQACVADDAGALPPAPAAHSPGIFGKAKRRNAGPGGGARRASATSAGQ